MAEDASCLLKAGAGKYVLWRPNGNPLTIENSKFIAHRLTRHGVVVGAVNDADTTDEAGNKVKHSWGAWWDFTSNKPIPLTRTDGYTWPKNASPLLNYGSVYSATLTNEFGFPLFITNVTSFPTLHDVWDMNSAGVSVGSLSMQASFAPQQILFDSLGTMTWFTPSERGLDAGRGGSPATQVNYWAQLTTAAQFNSAENWRWLGPLNWVTPTAYATLINDAGMIAGVSAMNTGDPIMDALRPTHAFRVSVSGEATPFNTLTTDLGTLTNGLHSFPRAMNGFGEVAGYSDLDLVASGNNPRNQHGVFWAADQSSPQDLGALGGFAHAPVGFSDAYGINDRKQIVGSSFGFGYQNFYHNIVPGSKAAVLWSPKLTVLDSTWQIDDLNFRREDDPWYLRNALGINDDGIILCEGLRASAGASVGLTPESRAAVLIPVGVRSRDRFFEGTIDLPPGVAPDNVYVAFTLDEPYEVIAGVSGQERIYASREVALQQGMQKIASFLGGQGEKFVDKVILYRDTLMPEKLHFVGYSPRFGDLQIKVVVQGRHWPAVEHKLEQDAAFTEFALHFDSLSYGKNGNEQVDAPPTPINDPPPLQFAGIGEFVEYQRGQPYTGDDQTLTLYQEALTALMLESLIKDELKLPVVYYWGIFGGFRDGVVFDVEALKQVADFAARSALNANPLFLPFTLPKSIEAFKARVEAFLPLVDYIATLRAEDVPVIAKNLGRSLYSQWTTKVQSDAGWIYDGQPIGTNPEIMRKYTEGYVGGFVGEQVVITLLTAGGTKYVQAARLPEVVGWTIKILEAARGGLLGVTLEGAKTARAGLLATYLTYAAKAPEESWLRRLAQSPFKVDTYLKGSRFGNETLDKLFEQLGKKGVLEADRVIAEMGRTRNFKPLQATPEVLEAFQARYAEVLAKLERELPQGSWIGTEGTVSVIDNLFPPGQADRVPDLLKALNVEDGPAARQWAVETLAGASGKSSDEILSQGLKVSARIADVYPIMYYHGDRSMFKYLQMVGEVDGRSVVSLAPKGNGRVHYVSPNTANNRQAVIELLQLPDQSGQYPNFPDTTGRYRLVFTTQPVANDLKIPRGYNHSPPPGTGLVPALEPVCIDNPARGTSEPRGGQFITEQGFTGYIEDTETGQPLTQAEIQALIDAVKTP